MIIGQANVARTAERIPGCATPMAMFPISMKIDATGELIAAYGQLGKETVRRVKPGEMNFDRVGGSCRPSEERPPNPPWIKERTEIWHLWPRFGLINCKVVSSSLGNRAIKASFHKTNDESEFELPFSCYDVERRVKYYAFKNAYFALERGPVSPWPVGQTRKVYWLSPEGNVQTIVLPYSSAIRESMVPTARGIVAFSRPATRDEDYGVYLVSTGPPKRILRGHAAGVTSPDGCKVAVLHDPDFDSRVEGRRVAAPITLKVLELCGVQ